MRVPVHCTPICLFALGAVMLWAPLCPATVVVVSGDSGHDTLHCGSALAPCKSIQQGLDNAHSGDEVHLRLSTAPYACPPHTQPQPFSPGGGALISKDLTLVGVPWAEMDCLHKFRALLVNASNVVIRNLAIRNTAGAVNGGAIFASINVKNTTARNIAFGLHNVTVEHSRTAGPRGSRSGGSIFHMVHCIHLKCTVNDVNFTVVNSTFRNSTADTGAFISLASQLVDIARLTLNVLHNRFLDGHSYHPGACTEIAPSGIIWLGGEAPVTQVNATINGNLFANKLREATGVSLSVSSGRSSLVMWDNTFVNISNRTPLVDADDSCVWWGMHGKLFVDVRRVNSISSGAFWLNARGMFNTPVYASIVVNESTFINSRLRLSMSNGEGFVTQMTVTNCVFRNITRGVQALQVQASDVQHLLRLNVTVLDSTFSDVHRVLASSASDDPADGGGGLHLLGVVDGVTNGLSRVELHRVSFRRVGAAGPGGAVMVNVGSGMRLDLHMTDVTFHDCASGNFGGAMSVLSSAFPPATLTLQRVTFQDNECTQLGCWGGALYTNGQLHFTDVSFLSNSAVFVGGAAALLGGLQSSANWQRVQVVGNKAAVVGSALFSSSSGPITIQGSTFALQVHSAASTQDGINIRQSQRVVLTGGTTLTCPAGSVLTNSNASAPRGGGVDVVFSCLPCPDNTYSVDASVQVDNIPPRIQCLSCPQGGLCAGNHNIAAASGWYGFTVGLSDGQRAVDFVQCPQFYCGATSGSNEGIKPCRYNRTGTLCGACLQGFSQALPPPVCVLDSNCQDGPWFFLVLLLLAAVWLTWMASRPLRSSGGVEQVLFFYQYASFVVDVDRSVHALLALFQFQVSPSTSSAICPIRGLTTLGSLFLPFLVPVVLLFVLGVAWGLTAWYRNRTRPACDDKQMALLADGDDVNGTGDTQRACEATTVHVCGHRFTFSVGSAVVFVLVFTFSNTADTTLRLLHCVSVPSQSTLYLLRAATTQCYEWWQGFLFVLLLGVVAFPFALLFVRQADGTRRPTQFLSLAVFRDLRGPAVSAKQGTTVWQQMQLYLESPLRTSRRYWKSVPLLLLLALAINSTFVQSVVVQNLVAGALVLLVLVACAAARPFAATWVNVLQLCLFGILLLVIQLEVPESSFFSAGVQVVHPSFDAHALNVFRQFLLGLPLFCLVLAYVSRVLPAS